jgi:hypothetical protein
MAVAGPLKKAGKAISSGASKASSTVGSVGTAIGAPVANVISKIDSYVDNTLVKDLTVVGNAIKDQLDKLVCGSDVGLLAVTVACSLSLSTAICSAFSGAAPGCVPESFKLMEKVAIAVGLTAVSIIFRCTFYHILKTLPGLCKGRAYGIASLTPWCPTLTRICAPLLSAAHVVLPAACSCAPTRNKRPYARVRPTRMR